MGKIKPWPFLCVAAFFIFPGCAFSSWGMFGILKGWSAWAAQDWPVSISSFMTSAEKAESENNALLHEYAIYGLASTYLAQDEYESALVRLAELEDSASPAIRAGMWYQTGIIAFRKGEYDQAADFFRKSLEEDPSGLDAKINLELSRLSLVERKADRSASSSGIQEDNEQTPEAEAIFTLVRKKEQDRWKNQEEKKPQEGIADY